MINNCDTPALILTLRCNESSYLTEDSELEKLMVTTDLPVLVTKEFVPSDLIKLKNIANEISSFEDMKKFDRFEREFGKN